MLEIRNKRGCFHQSIRKIQRQSIRIQVRRIVSQQLSRNQVLNCMDEAFSILGPSDNSKKTFWKKEFIHNQILYPSPFDIIDSVCQGAIYILGDNQKNQVRREQVCSYLYQFLAYLLPHSQIFLPELPKSFIQLSIYILKDSMFVYQQKESFVQLLDQQTVNKCLLAYFVQNWAQIKKNQCHDLTMRFFRQITQFKNIFRNCVNNEINFQCIINELVRQLMQVTQAQRRVYDMLQSQTCCFGSPLQQMSIFNPGNMTSDCSLSIERLLETTTFLCNLILLSPQPSQPSYNIKQKRGQLRTIADYMYRKVYLQVKYKSQQKEEKEKNNVEYCLATLIGASADNLQQNDSRMVKIAQALISHKVSKTKQTKAKSTRTIQLRHQPYHNKPQRLQCKDYNQQLIQDCELFPLNDDGRYFQNIMITKVKLMMIHSLLARDVYQGGFGAISKFIKQQLLSSRINRNVLSLQNPSMISRFLMILTLLLHQSYSYNKQSNYFYSYDNNIQHSDDNTSQAIQNKIRIFNLIKFKGFEQLICHENLRGYCEELGGLLVEFVRDLGKVGGVVGQLVRDRWQAEDQVSEDQNQEQNDQYLDQEPYSNLNLDFQEFHSLSISNFKKNIYQLCIQFLQRTYKYLNFKTKQKLILNLILQDQLTFLNSETYCTKEQLQKIKNNSFYKYGQYSQSEEHQGCQECSGDQERHGDQQLINKPRININKQKCFNEYYILHQEPLKQNSKNSCQTRHHEDIQNII